MRRPRDPRTSTGRRRWPKPTGVAVGVSAHEPANNLRIIAASALGLSATHSRAGNQSRGSRGTEERDRHAWHPNTKDVEADAARAVRILATSGVGLTTGIERAERPGAGGAADAQLRPSAAGLNGLGTAPNATLAIDRLGPARSAGPERAVRNVCTGRTRERGGRSPRAKVIREVAGIDRGIRGASDEVELRNERIGLGPARATAAQTTGRVGHVLEEVLLGCELIRSLTSDADARPGGVARLVGHRLASNERVLQKEPPREQVRPVRPENSVGEPHTPRGESQDEADAVGGGLSPARGP